MLEEHPGVSPSPFSSLFLFMWGQTPSLTSSLPFPLTKAPHYYVCWFVYSVIKRQEVAVAMLFRVQTGRSLLSWTGLKGLQGPFNLCPCSKGICYKQLHLPFVSITQHRWDLVI